MKEELISFECAKLAKEKGFDWKHSDFYIDKNKGEYSTYDAVTQSLLQKWLREEYNIHVSVFRLANTWTSKPFDVINSKYMNMLKNYKKYNTYEQALEEGLIEALKLI